jgi:hypothetical protein
VKKEKWRRKEEKNGTMFFAISTDDLLLSGYI